MRCWIGIDLGSTTTKAVVLDESARILGRGITNSRNNYDAACGVARGEALIDARFTLARRSLGEEGREVPRERGGAGIPAIRPSQETFASLLERSFRLEQHLCQLRQLRETTVDEAESWARRYEEEPLSATVEEIFRRMEGEAARLFAPGVRRKSDFFRDIAGSQYLALAEEAVRSLRVPFEVLAGLFDKSILKVENRPQDLSFQTHIRAAIARALEEAPEKPEVERERIRSAVEDVAGVELEVIASVGTGYGRARLPFPKERIRSEILCHGLGAHALFPGTATVLDIGGQDTKAIQVDGDGIVTSFQMNDRCAAGCGRYLGYIADEMNLGLHELGPMAETSRSPVRISSTCTVFAGAEIRDRLAIGQRREDILAGLHRSIILRAMSLLARSGGIHDEFTFTGGVAKNPAAVAALERLVREAYGERKINISPDSIYTGALGAALFAMSSDREAADDSAEVHAADAAPETGGSW